MTNRGIHRDFAYFYIGLIIAFSFSGIILNHRQDWYPMDYSYENKEVEIKEVINKSEFSKEELAQLASKWDVEYDGHRIRDEKLRVYFKNNIILDLNLNDGKGNLEYKRKVPIIGHSMYLHKTTNNWWIWYSDIFGIAMLVIAITGLLIPVKKNGFKERGWKLALAGMVFPLIFLIFLS